MKKKIANILRRWANRISPDAAPGFTSDNATRFQAALHYSRKELREIERDPAQAVIIDRDRHRELLAQIAQKMYEQGAITFHTEPELCPDSHDVLIATCYAVDKRWNDDK